MLIKEAYKTSESFTYFLLTFNDFKLLTFKEELEEIYPLAKCVSLKEVYFPVEKFIHINVGVECLTGKDLTHRWWWSASTLLQRTLEKRKFEAVFRV